MKTALERSNINVVVAFWNPSTALCRSIQGQEVKKGIIGIQCTLEGTADAGETVLEREKELRNYIRAIPNIAGELKIVNVSHAANFTCLIIDEELFFFPFLSGPDSTNDPTIHCTTETGIGKRIYEHFVTLLKNAEVTDTVYHREKNANRIDRL